MKILEVLVEHSVAKLNTPFTYVCDDSLDVKVGYRVFVPFHNQNIVAYVIKVTNSSLSLNELIKRDNIEYKYIHGVLDYDAIIDDELFALAKKMENDYVTPLIGCLQTILPPSYRPSRSAFNKYKGKFIKKAFPMDGFDEKNTKLTKKQLEVYHQIKDKNGIFIKDLSVSIVAKLEQAKAIKIQYEEVKEDLLKPFDATKPSHTLNEDQQKVYDEIISTNDTIYLLEGVTGSGKTEVYIKLVRHYLSLGKTAIILVPEISLTPMIIERFKSQFNDIAILHGSLSAKERQIQYDKIKNQEARVVIGARSAIFAPLKNIGIIILDEEQSTSYKQDKMPSYHARDIAIYRANYHHSKLILGSATPSFESKARATKGVYHLLRLDRRANNKELPPIQIINMREDCSDFSPLISNSLDYEINRCLDKNEKMILLHNRRGYSPYVSCRRCGYIFKCPNCELSMSYHKNGDKFKCHYCNQEIKFDHVCPKCQENDFLFMGSGTEKIEEVIANHYPKAKILRMDNDTTSKKNGHLSILNDFEKKDYNILLGTQMVAKGLDFHDVTLVGVINADITLAVADFRSAEFTFELLSQVAGRAGRGSKQGNVIIQSYNPDHYSIVMASTHNYDAFYLKDMSFRSKLKYPPFSYMSSITVLCSRSDQACILADKIYAYLKDKTDFEMLGPALPYVFKENDKVRVKILIKSKKKDLITSMLNEVNKTFMDESIKRDCSIQYDIDTYQLL